VLREATASIDNGQDLTCRLRTLLSRHPSFGTCGVEVPADAGLWQNDDLARFVLSDGFLRPQQRFNQAPALWVPHLEAAAQALPELHSDPGVVSDAPRVIWTYWEQGAEALGPFRRLCLHSWAAQNPGWRLCLLDRDSALRVADGSRLPEAWGQMSPEHASDALRLCLLEQYGGVWADVATICLRPLDEWVWHRIGNPCCREGLASFYTAWCGVIPGTKEYVENWFMAARRGHPMIAAWRDLFVRAWHGHSSCFTVAFGPLFRGVDLDHLGSDKRFHLTMHACFKKLIDEDPELRRVWKEEMLLLRADDLAFAWMDGISTEEECLQRWIFRKDDAWVDMLLQRKLPLLKFIGDFSRGLDAQPVEHLIRHDNCIARLLVAALTVPPNNHAASSWCGDKDGAIWGPAMFERVD